MTLALVLAVAGAVFWYRHNRNGRRPGAGASGIARARKLRTPLVRLASLLGISTARGRLADRSDIGAAGEQATALLLDPLRTLGWTVLHDRALPTGRANVDHLVVSRSGVVFVVDSKQWDRRFRVRVVGGRLLHGNRDVTGRLRGLRHEADTVARVLDCAVVRVVAMHGAPVEGGELLVEGVRIVPASRVSAVLRSIGRRRAAAGTHQGDRATALFPPHGRR
ncbi:nuclease-related domain-containing protein [Actinacidiphila sp. ITFR-21]|uniref:nuclease-related domain-containing protein n=1 Tax=Actinacidiphila sp. ITFR-21 TaxID=3075199 RepID=UPI002889505E|nr:nuclease-related domain-containing protein [Streptomyces sp. ITFR-21]WNI20364.1 nuclease-related domain-containing protein [Streptomyces sp. ITFR-21]